MTEKAINTCSPSTVSEGIQVNLLNRTVTISSEDPPLDPESSGEVEMIPFGEQLLRVKSSVTRPSSVETESWNDAVVRQREFEAIAKQSKGAFEQQLEREKAAMQSHFDEELNKQQQVIEQLRCVVMKKDTEIDSLKQKIQEAENKTVTEVRSAVQGQMMLVEEMKCEVNRLLSEKEKLHFVSRTSITRAEAQTILADTTTRRAHEAEISWQNQRIMDLVVSCEHEKQLYSISCFDYLHEVNECFQLGERAINNVQREHDYAGQRLCGIIRGHLKIDEEFGISALPLVLQQYVQKEEKEKQSTHGLLSDLRQQQNEVENLRLHFAAESMRLQERDDRQQHCFREKIESLEKRVGSLCSKLEGMIGVRASVKASANIVEKMVVEHQEEVEGHKNEILKLRQAVDFWRLINRHAEAEHLAVKISLLEQEKKQITEELCKLRSRVQTIEMSTTVLETDCKQLIDQLRTKNEQVLEATKAKEVAQSKHADHVLALNSQITELSDALTEEKKKLILARESVELSNIEQLRRGEDFTKLQERCLRVEEENRVLQLLVRSHDSPKNSDSTRSTTAESLLTLTEELTSLREKMLHLRKERDTLKKRLDSAMADAGAAEERRNISVGRCLTLMAAEDSAPRLQQALLQKQKDLQEIEHSLERRETELNKRASELDQLEGQLKANIAFPHRQGVGALVQRRFEGTKEVSKDQFSREKIILQPQPTRSSVAHREFSGIRASSTDHPQRFFLPSLRSESK